MVAVGSSTGVSVYENSSGVWNVIGAKISFGNYACLSADGNRIAIGNPDKYTIRNYVFSNNSWIQRGVDVKKWNGSDFGESLDLTPDGETLIGASSVTFPKVYTFNEALLSVKNALPELKGFIFPNPTKDIFEIKISDDLEFQEVILFNTIGKKVFKSKTSSLDISKLVKGVYYLRITTNKGFITKKVMKN